ncbi:DUF397 domain-containing protein [Streptomyces natalensis]|uniref:DUF397 domain-containing protein n=1 Tax=Streptomyces natalensis ATCC 27448 TaxID=1240678 RepID=A0A0D7CBH0_9ACTN|nr:DUF397 domain-containing protein [Streptomyces natalensis]KIZ13603.1 hypothetical protein SNA_36895 [Streptomyces natalensis ATCC 27448]
MANLNLHSATWRKSSYSGTGGNCVEVADGLPGVIPVRDSKHGDGPVLRFRSETWYVFIDMLKASDTATS